MAEQRTKDAWKTYPKSLPASTYDPLEFNIKEHAKRLAAYPDATSQTDRQLHQPDVSEAEVDDCSVRCLQGKNGCRKIDLRNVKAAESMLETTTAKSSSTFIAIAPPFQGFSQGHLICREALQKILSFLAVFPAFLEILHTFFPNPWGTSDSGLYSQHCNLPPQNTDNQKVQSEASYVSCFSLSDVEKKKKMDWAQRKVGAWMSYHPADNRSVWVYLNASDGFWARLKDLTQSDSANGIKRSDLDATRLLLSSVHENWSNWLDLEQEYQELRTVAILSMYSRVTSRLPPIEHAQNLEQQLARLEEPYNFLETNHHVIRSMKLGFEKFRRLSAENTAKLAQDAEFVEFAASLEEYLLKTSRHQKRMSALKKGYYGVITRILRYNTLQETEVPMEVSQEKEMRFSMRTVIAMMVYNPLTFIIVLFSIESVKETSQGRFMRGILAFLLYTLVMAAAMGCWLGYKKCAGRKQKPDVETGMLKNAKPIVLKAGGTAKFTGKRVPVGSQEK